MEKSQKKPREGGAVKAILLPALALLLIAGVSSFLLAFVNDVTAPIIAERETAERAEAMAAVLPAAATFSEEKTVSLTVDGEDEEIVYYEGLDSTGALIGYVFTASGAGYGGDVAVMTGVDMDGVVTNIEITSINETPGLGMRAQEESFLSQYIGKSGSLTVSKTAAGDEIQALTGATITSTAVTDAVNAALAAWQTITGGTAA